MKSSPCFPSKSVIDLALLFRSSIHLESIFTMWSKSPMSLFFIWIFSFPNTICWKDCPFPIEWSWLTYWKIFDDTSEDFLCVLYILFHWSIFMSLCQVHNVLILKFYNVLRSANGKPPTLFFFLKTVWAI